MFNMETTLREKVWVDVSKIPMFLGANINERLEKWMEFAKLGILLFDSTQA